MAQAQPEEKITESQEKGGKESNASGSSSSFKFNAQAPEFVPSSHSHAQTIPTPSQISSYYYPCFQILGGAGASDWLYVGNQDPSFLIANTTNVTLPNSSKNILADDLQNRIVKQVEYQFSDMSLLANETLMKHMSKDPESYVPISLIASPKKIKSLVSNNHLLVQALRSSSKLIVSDDGKKVKRRHPFTEKDKEDLQTRTVVADHLPEDHSYSNLQKIFSVVGSVKTIRICHPPESNTSRPKGEVFISNKLHALVEYESPEVAEKAVEKLHDERNWRKGLRVRVLLRCSPKSVLKNRKLEFDSIIDDNDPQNAELAEDSFHLGNTDSLVDNNGEENSGGSKKGWSKGRGKGKGRGQSQGGRCLLTPIPATSSSLLTEATCKQNIKGPRMPDGTRGFTMGRGRPISNPVLAAGSLQE